MFVQSDLLALAAAACWAIGSLLSVGPSRYLGAFSFTRWRMLMVALMLWLVVGLTQSWQDIKSDDLAILALSGLIGIFIGDTALFSAMNRLGPRRAGILFATHAAFSAVLGAWVFGEKMNTQGVFGGCLTLAGVMIAVAFGSHKNEAHAWEKNSGKLWLGVILGLVAALCQAMGAIIVKPVMSEGIDPIAASAVRVSVALIAHFFLFWLGVKVVKSKQSPNLRLLGVIALNGFISMGVGMSLIFLALEKGDVGTVGILSSVSPILLLPFLWWHSRRIPAPGAWLGACTTVAGTVILICR